MAQKVSYYELLKHPKWQKRRLEVLQEAGFRCEKCGAEDATLHVHHAYYEKGLAPWDYPAQSLHNLCENCHKRAQDRADLGVVRKWRRIAVCQRDCARLAPNQRQVDRRRAGSGERANSSTGPSP